MLIDEQECPYCGHRVKELYDSYCHRGGYDQFRDGVLVGIGKTIDLLGVEVKGVNTE